ncbi:alpha/beta hydrolase fold domain-containing protein [Paracoccus sp. S-4012]|uniref:alpha/beta hydrolase n=1 Tax=Paracoccus sp. S-4012 TaxID=2665648 RepID=UPI0012AF0463|nr:alpha/beta hydrolase [Paracoccus sp. S-4012]MRX51463.1 alpha/beta hydrolase fold domain-containing protein [Paracoccus sp. S-4012]
MMARTDPVMDRDFSLDSVQGLDALFARRRSAAEAALSRCSATRVAYGPQTAHRMTLMAPSGARGPAPVQMFIHGGFWKSLDADSFAFLAPAFVEHGALLALIDYPLIPSVRMADLIAACAEGLRWLHANVAAHGGDPERLHISGHSAGGHVVAELLDMPALSPMIRGVTAISGIYDLEPVTRSFQNADLGLTAEEVARFSPLSREISPDAPLLVAVGGAETAEFLRQSRAFAARCDAPCLEVPGANHITVLLDELAVPGTGFHREVLRRMGLPG